MRIVAGLSILLLASCHHLPVATPFTTPDGKPAFTTTCDTAAQTWANCMETARKSCGGNFTELRRTDSERAYENLKGRSSYPTRTLEFSCAAHL